MTTINDSLTFQSVLYVVLTILYFTDKILVLPHKILQYHYYDNLKEKSKRNISFSFAQYGLSYFILHRVQLSLFCVSPFCFSSVSSNEVFITFAKLISTRNI